MTDRFKAEANPKVVAAFHQSEVVTELRRRVPIFIAGAGSKAGRTIQAIYRKASHGFTRDKPKREIAHDGARRIGIQPADFHRTHQSRADGVENRSSERVLQ